DSAVVQLISDRVLTVDEQQRTVFHQHNIYVINSANGIEDWSEIHLRWEPWHEDRPEIRARVITPDGSVHELDPKTIVDVAVRDSDNHIFSDAHRVEAPLPAVAVGSVIEREIIVREHLPLFAAGRVRRFYFNSTVPV